MTARDYEIRLEGVRAFGRHGVLASERRGVKVMSWWTRG